MVPKFWRDLAVRVSTTEVQVVVIPSACWINRLGEYDFVRRAVRSGDKVSQPRLRFLLRWLGVVGNLWFVLVKLRVLPVVPHSTN